MAQKAGATHPPTGGETRGCNTCGGSANWALIGNCSYSAIIENGAIKWLCWPVLDSSFVFGSLLDEDKGGEFVVQGQQGAVYQQAYVESTNVVKTTITSETGVFEVLDFAPRFLNYERHYKPSMLCRILRLVSGQPIVKVRCRPVYDYGRLQARESAESNHIEYLGLGQQCRLTTNIPLTYVQGGRPFVLARESHLCLSWGQPLEAPLEETVNNFYTRTVRYWHSWVKHARIPRDYQEHVIRSALILKLHQFEDTGAFTAATTTSIAEYPKSGRCWDYRYCWLRDTYFTVNAFEKLGLSDVSGGCGSLLKSK